MAKGFKRLSTSSDIMRRETQRKNLENKKSADEFRKIQKRFWDKASLILWNDGEVQSYKKSEEQIKDDEFSFLQNRLRLYKKWDLWGDLSLEEKQKVMLEIAKEMKSIDSGRLQDLVSRYQNAWENVDVLNKFEKKNTSFNKRKEDPIELVSMRLYKALNELKNFQNWKLRAVDEEHAKIAEKYPEAMKHLGDDERFVDTTNDAQLKSSMEWVFSYSGALSEKIEEEWKFKIKFHVRIALDDFLKKIEEKIRLKKLEEVTVKVSGNVIEVVNA